MKFPELERRVQDLQRRLTPEFVEAQVRTLLRQGEDVGGGVNAFRLVKHLLGAPLCRDAQVTWAYTRLKPALRAALDQLSALYFFEGD